LYLTEDLPSSSKILSTFNASLLSSVTSPTNQYLGRISATQASTNTNYQFYNLSGNKYLTAVANFSGTVSTYKMNVTDIIIQGGYQ
jgi:hypothetical protein